MQYAPTFFLLITLAVGAYCVRSLSIQPRYRACDPKSRDMVAKPATLIAQGINRNDYAPPV